MGFSFCLFVFMVILKNKCLNESNPVKNGRSTLGCAAVSWGVNVHVV